MLRPRIAAFALLVACLAPLAFPAESRAGQVLYYGHGTFKSAAPLTIGGVTATAGGATLNVDNTIGLGVVGGSYNMTIDANESVLFHFEAGPATGVSFSSRAFSYISGSGTMENLEAFDSRGLSLGTVTFDENSALSSSAGAFQVSPLFGDVALSGFRIYGSGDGSGLAVSQIDFATQVVPEPSTLAAAGIGLAALGAIRLRRARRAA